MSKAASRAGERIPSISFDIVSETFSRQYSLRDPVEPQLRPSSGDAVHAFLSTANPSMGELAIVFVQGGIVSEEHLTALASLPQVEQLQFFRHNLGLNALQARAVQQALVDRKMGKLSAH